MVLDGVALRVIFLVNWRGGDILAHVWCSFTWSWLESSLHMEGEALPDTLTAVRTDGARQKSLVPRCKQRQVQLVVFYFVPLDRSTASLN